MAVVLLVFFLAIGGAAGLWFMIQNGHSGDVPGGSHKVAQGTTSSSAVVNDSPLRTEPKSPPKASQPVQTQAKNPPQATQPQVPQRDPEPKPQAEPKTKDRPDPEPKKALPVAQMQATIKKHLLDNANDPDSVEIAGFSEPLEVEIERPAESNLDQLVGADGMPRKKNWQPGAIITCKFRAKNAIGAKVLEEVVYVFLLDKEGLKFFGPKSLPRNMPEDVRVLAAVSTLGIAYRKPGSGWRPVTKELCQAYRGNEGAADKK
ncbi:hypothetical protein AYO44_07055 [Planctomycetaceae bacterium SCGC AG-212-F19]|nr:hypothetical protein AYO44_07055 [Planctomycetaceae bacterium SCGC AG-212-F19]